MNDRTKYHRTITGVDGRECIVDVYSVLEAFGVTCPAIQHAAKKLLCPGRRAKGSTMDDLGGAALAIERAIQIEQARGTDKDYLSVGDGPDNRPMPGSSIPTPMHFGPARLDSHTGGKSTCKQSLQVGDCPQCGDEQKEMDPSGVCIDCVESEDAYEIGSVAEDFSVTPTAEDSSVVQEKLTKAIQERDCARSEKAKLDGAIYMVRGHLETVVKERDRLAAENAEMRRTIGGWYAKG